MKWIKWVIGVIFAGIITVYPASLIMHHTGKVDMNHLTPFQYWIKFLLIPSASFGLFVFLACLFVPMYKKFAGILVFSLVIILVGLGSYQHYIDNGVFQNQYIVRYFGFVVGIIAGFLFSYKMFKYNKWDSFS